MQAANRHHVEVAVRHLESREHDADSLGLEAHHLRPADGLRRLGQVIEQGRLQVEPVVDLVARHDQRVTGPQRAVGQEDDAAVVLPDEARGQPAFDDLGEDRRHAQDSSL